MMKKYTYLIALLSLIFCSKEKPGKTEVIENPNVKVSSDSTSAKTISFQTNDGKNLNTRSEEIIHTLKKKNYEEFSQYIHSKKGITFSIYPNINPEKDKHFSAEDFDKYIKTETKFTWGEQDGTGDLLVLPIRDYIHDWVFKRDFTDSEYFENQFKGSGNTLNTIKKNYPNCVFTENFIAGTEIYSGMDWNSLILIYEEYEGKLFLVGLVNNGWTT